MNKNVGDTSFQIADNVNKVVQNKLYKADLGLL